MICRGWRPPGQLWVLDFPALGFSTGDPVSLHRAHASSLEPETELPSWARMGSHSDLAVCLREKPLPSHRGGTVEGLGCFSDQRG